MTAAHDATADVCLFGGSFDPPHRTHTRLARAVLDQLPVREVIVLPSGVHPLKQGKVTPAHRRVELCRLAFATEPRVRVDDWDARRTTPCYTVETLEHFREYVTHGRRPYWLVGSDNLAILPQWHRYRDLVRLAVLVTFPRHGHPVTAEFLDRLALPLATRDELRAHVLDVEPDAVSATEVRVRLLRGEPADHLLEPAVAQRIAADGLYQESWR